MPDSIDPTKVQWDSEPINPLRLNGISLPLKLMKSSGTMMFSLS